MNITQVKSAIADNMNIKLPNLVMVRQFNEANEPQQWLSHWDNENRVRVTMHQEVFDKISADPNKPGLAFKKETVEAAGERLAYTRFVIITPNNIVGTF